MKAWVFAGCLLGFAHVAFCQTSNRVLWTFSTGRYVFSSPAIAKDGDAIYIGSGNGRLYALRPDGTMKWSFATGAEVQSSPAIGRDGTIYFGSADYKVYAVNPDGSKQWEFRTDGIILCSPTLGADGTIYIGSRDGSFYALEADGRQKWCFGTGRQHDMPAVIGPEGTILISAAGTIYALKHNGEVRWQKRLGASDLGVGMAIGRGGTIYAAFLENGPGRTLLFALTHRGEILWEFACGRAMAIVNPSFPAVARDGTIYLPTPDGFLYAINRDGTLQWKAPGARSQSSSPALSGDGRIYLNSSFDFRLLSYDLEGRLEWEQVLPNRTGASGLMSSFPTLKDGVIFVGSGSGDVYAVQASGELEEGNWPAFGRDHQHTGRDLQRGIEAAMGASGEELRLNIEPGKAYVLQGSSDLLYWADCTNILSATARVTLPRIGGHSFYRLAAP